MFPTDFVIDLVFEMLPKHGTFPAIPASLICKEKEYKLIFHPDSSFEKVLSAKAPIFMWNNFSSFFKLSDCRLEGEVISLITDNSNSIGLRTHFDMTSKVRKWEISLDCFTIQKSSSVVNKNDINKRSFFLLNFGEDFVKILPYKDETIESIFNNLRAEYILKYKESDICLGYNKPVGYPYISITNYSPYILKEVLALLSFYYLRPIKEWISIRQDDSLTEYHFTSPLVSHEKKADSISEWDFYTVNENKEIDLKLIFDSTSAIMKKKPVLFHDILFRAIQTHTDIQNDSEQSQFVYYTNILLTISEKIHKYKNVKKLLKQAGIKFNLIDDEQNRLQHQHFKRTVVKEEKKGCIPKFLAKIFCKKMSYNEEINTFIDLRNEFVHGLPTPEMLTYIHNSLLLPKLKHCVFLIILFELGIHAKYTFHNNAYKIQK